MGLGRCMSLLAACTVLVQKGQDASAWTAREVREPSAGAEHS